MWIKKTSLGLNMGHGFLVFNLYVTYVVEDVKISDARTASSRGCPRFCLVCSLHADAHTLLVPSLGLRPCCLCSRGALWLRPFSHDTSHSLFPPSLSSECTPSAFPALGYWLQLLTVQWFHILFYFFNWAISSSKQGLLFHKSFLSFGAWCGTHSRCSVRTIDWLLLEGYLTQSFWHHF